MLVSRVHVPTAGRRVDRRLNVPCGLRAVGIMIVEQELTAPIPLGKQALLDRGRVGSEPLGSDDPREISGRQQADHRNGHSGRGPEVAPLEVTGLSVHRWSQT